MVPLMGFSAEMSSKIIFSEEFQSRKIQVWCLNLLGYTTLKNITKIQQNSDLNVGLVSVIIFQSLLLEDLVQGQECALESI